MDFLLIFHQLRGDIKHLFQCEIFMILDNTLNSWEILSHECRRIHRRSHEYSPNYWMLFTWLCNVRHSLLSVSHLVFDFVHKFCCVTAHDEIFGISLFLVMHWHKFPRSIVNQLSVPYGMRSSVEKRFFTMRGNLLHHIPRSFLRFPWSIVRRSSTFPLLRRPRLIIILFWIIWVTVSQVSLIYRHLQQISQDLDIRTMFSPGLMKLMTTRSKAFSLLNSSWVSIWLWHVLLLILVELVQAAFTAK